VTPLEAPPECCSGPADDVPLSPALPVCAFTNAALAIRANAAVVTIKVFVFLMNDLL
jgi:hypothetical protein